MPDVGSRLHQAQQREPQGRERSAREKLERFRAKACPALDAGWIPVRVKKTRQNKNPEPRSDSIGTEKALAAGFVDASRPQLQCNLQPRQPCDILQAQVEKLFDTRQAMIQSVGMHVQFGGDAFALLLEGEIGLQRFKQVRLKRK